MPDIALAGGTGDLGGRIARALGEAGATVRALVRPGADTTAVEALRRGGATTVAVDFRDIVALRRACEGAVCVVSALSGLRDAVVESQTTLLEAAVAAGVPRFIPSDFALDFTKIPAGGNRNLDLRRELRGRLEQAPIAATSILNGMFTHLLAGEAPFIVRPIRRVVYWRDPDQPLDFTTRDDVARYTARAALDATTPRFLRIAGDTRSARQLVDDAQAVYGGRFRLLRAGGLRRLDRIIAITRRLAPGRDATYPAWQGMQYMRDMFDGRGALWPLDNDRYPGLRFTTARETLEESARG